MHLDYDEARIRQVLPRAWSSKTAVQWTPANPALGQCNVTAAVIYDLFGGEILRTRLPDVWHYYNRIDGRRVDFTDSQFDTPGALFEAPQDYDDEQTSRESAMTGIPDREHQALRSALVRQLGAIEAETDAASKP